MLQNKRNISKKSIILFIIVVIIGLFVMIYPIISSKINYNESLEKIRIYSSNVSKNSEKVNKSLLEKALEYNSKMIGTNITDSFANETEESEEYLGLLNLSRSGIMGYIKIPKIDVEIPIYHGTSSKTLQKGVGHFADSSLPIGGESTHSILSGHRGSPSSRIFTDLDQLKEDDMFYIYVLDKVLAYKVDQVKTVEPSETKDLAIVEGEDFVTLVTCTPYAINTHRLLVRGKRVEYDEKVLNNIKASKKITISDVIFLGGLLIAFMIIIFTIKKIMKINEKLEVLKSSTAEIETLNDEILEDENLSKNESLNTDEIIIPSKIKFEKMNSKDIQKNKDKVLDIDEEDIEIL